MLGELGRHHAIPVICLDLNSNFYENPFWISFLRFWVSRFCVFAFLRFLFYSCPSWDTDRQSGEIQLRSRTTGLEMRAMGED